jgi:hypothetical protein
MSEKNLHIFCFLQFTQEYQLGWRGDQVRMNVKYPQSMLSFLNVASYSIKIGDTSVKENLQNTSTWTFQFVDESNISCKQDCFKVKKWTELIIKVHYHLNFLSDSISLQARQLPLVIVYWIWWQGHLVWPMRIMNNVCIWWTNTKIGHKS